MLYGVTTRNGARNGGSRPTTIDVTPPIERAFLVAVDTGQDAGWTAEESLTELANLANTAGAEVVGAEWQNRRHVDPNWYVGKGKAEELVQAKSETGFTMLVADDEISAQPAEGLESLLGVKVLDRCGLILDIFAQHARTHEGRLQVELAQLEYQLPRLTRLWTHLSRTRAASARADPARRSWKRTGASSAIASRSSRSGSSRSAASARRPPAPRSAPRTHRRDRGLHQRGQVVAAQLAGRLGTGAGRGSALRHARSHVAHSQAWATASRWS